MSRTPLLPALVLVLAVAVHAPARPAPAPSTDTVRGWNEDLDLLAREMPARHADLFHTMGRAEFDSALSSIRSRLPRLERHELIVELMRLAARVGDGHTNVSPWRDTVAAFHRLPVALYRFADGYRVRAADRAHADLVGARVVAIGGIPIDSAEARVAPLIGRDNAMGVWMWAPLLLQMPEVLHATGLAAEPTGAGLTVESRGRRRTVRLPSAGPFPDCSGEIDRSWDVPAGWVDARDGAPAPLWLSRTRESCWFAPVPGSRILYCQLNEVLEKDEPLAAFFARALGTADSVGAEKFVLDLRLDGGGNNHFCTDIVRALVRSRFDAPDRLFVVTGRRTFSAAEMLICDLERWSHPVFVGEPAASRGNHYGDSRKIVLPHVGVTVRVSTLRWQYWDPRDTRPWIAPQVAAPLTFDAYAAGRDPALEAIARYEPHEDLLDALMPLLRAGDGDAAWRAIETFRADPVNAWRDVPLVLEYAKYYLHSEGRDDGVALAKRLGERLGSGAPVR